jgi:hypothetical protein
VSLSISPSYVKGWTPADAFRELYQNWYVQTFSAGQTLMNTERMPSSKDSMRTARASYHSWKTTAIFSQLLSPATPCRPAGERENRRALGFIRYDKKTGCITIVNACMQLPIDALTMGFSTKDAHASYEHLVRRHDDGLKLAALILSLDRYTVSIAASSCNWRFDMHADTASVSCTVAPS